MTWHDANTFKVDADTGTQTLLLHYCNPQQQLAHWIGWFVDRATGICKRRGGALVQGSDLRW
jgi:hypothetical protein